MTSFISLSLQALWDRKLRSILTITMVVIGVGLIIAVQGMSAGAVSYMNGQFASLGSDLLIVNPGGQDITDLVIEDIMTFDGVKDVIPFYQNQVQLSTLTREKGSIILAADIDKLQLAFPTFILYEGEYFDRSDNYGMVIGSDLSDFAKEEPFALVDDTLTLSFQIFSSGSSRPEVEKKSFAVKGIIDEIGMQGFLPMDDMGFISLRAGELLFDRENYDGMYVITTETDGSLNRRVERAIEAEYEISVFSPKRIADVVSSITTAIKDFVDNIAIVSLGVAAVGIITTLYTSMMERTKEIGTLKALGYTKRQILALFLNEAILIGIIGGTLGVFLGFGLGVLMNLLIGEGSDYVKPIYELNSIVIAWVLAIILSTLAGFYPAKKAADLDPVVALRKE